MKTKLQSPHKVGETHFPSGKTPIKICGKLMKISTYGVFIHTPNHEKKKQDAASMEKHREGKNAKTEKSFGLFPKHKKVFLPLLR